MVEIFIGLLSLALMISLMYIHSLNCKIKSLNKLNETLTKHSNLSKVLTDQMSKQINLLKQEKEK